MHHTKIEKMVKQNVRKREYRRKTWDTVEITHDVEVLKHMHTWTKKVLAVVAVIVVLALIALGTWLYFLFGSNPDLKKFTDRVFTYEILETYKHIHDPSVVNPTVSNISENRPQDNKRFPFTQGLFFTDNEKLIESEGIHGQSVLREFNLMTGNSERYINVNKHFFGEGATIIIEPSTLKKIICQLTYKEKTVLLYDYETFMLYNKIHFDYEGYGLVSNYNISYENVDLRGSDFLSKQKLWATTGDEYLYELNIPNNLKTAHAFTIKKKTRIHCLGFQIDQVNELEYNLTQNSLYGNIYLTNFIIEFNPVDGNCIKLIDLSGLKKKIKSTPGYVDDPDNVLNGIAVHPLNKDPKEPVVYVTGKRWPQIFKIRFKEDSNGNYVAHALKKNNFSIILKNSS